MLTVDDRRLERFRYWRGQALRSRDFRDGAFQDDERRFWHNRALHQAFGVVDGLKVEQSPSAVRVSPGLAYDRFGREILLRQAVDVALPPGPSANKVGFVALVIRRRRSRSCGGAELVWRESSARRAADEVPLERFLFSESVSKLDPDPKFVRPRVRPHARPHLASGSTIPGRTEWSDVPALGEEGGMIFQTSVDTSAAGFTKTPCYFAWLESALVDGEAALFLPALFTQIADETATGFVFRIWHLWPLGNRGVGRSLLARARMLHLRVIRTFAEFQTFNWKQRLAVSWVGCQPEKHPPLPNAFVSQDREEC